MSAAFSVAIGVVRVDIDGRRVWVASCSCGWRSALASRTRWVARRFGDEHGADHQQRYREPARVTRPR